MEYFSVVSNPNKLYGIRKTAEDAEELLKDVEEISDRKLDGLRIENGIWANGMRNA